MKKVIQQMSIIFSLFSAFGVTYAACGTRNNGDGTITVIRTGLQYQACPVGQHSIGRESYSWSEGVVYEKCEGVAGITSREAIARYSKGEWRLITPEEAKGILTDIAECQPLNTWTSATNMGFTNRGGSTNFEFGVRDYSGDDRARTVQLVRSNVKAGELSSDTRQTKLSEDQKRTLLNQSESRPRDAEQQSRQAQQTAQQTQARADQQRQGKRKTHDPAAEAHECIAIDNAGSGNFGAFKNQCPYPVNFTTCNEKPRIIQGGFNWSADFDCAKQQFGLHTPKGNSSVAAHNRNTEFVYWYACKAPAMPADATYTPGKGIEARCHN